MLAKLRAATDTFFGRPPERKAAFGGEGSGWQPYGARLAGPDYPGHKGGRQSVMFFVNPPLDYDIPTFTGPPARIAEQVRRNNTAFGQAIPAGLA